MQRCFFFKVKLNDCLDKNEMEELECFRKSKTAEEIAEIMNILHNQFECPRSNENQPTIWSYAIFIFGTMLEILKELNTYEDFPISVNDSKKVHIGVRKSIEYGLKPYMLGESMPINVRLPNIITSTKILLELVNNKFFPLFCTRNDRFLVYTDLISCIFIILCNSSDEIKQYFEHHLLGIRKKLPQAEYFEILFMIMGSKSKLSNPTIVHEQLKQSLYQRGSFLAICEALMPSITSLDQDEEIVKKRLHSSNVIASIIAQKGHGRKFHHQIIDEIHVHLLKYIREKKSNQTFFADVGVCCLNRVCILQSKYIEGKILNIFEKMARPSDLVAGSIVCDENEFSEAVHLVHLTFCASGPSDDTLSSQILMPYMPLFIQIHNIIAECGNKSLNNQILDIIIRCLSNRTTSDLNRIIEWVLYEEYEENVKYLHPRLNCEHIIRSDIGSIRFIIAASTENTTSTELDFSTFLQPSLSIINILKKCNHNTLIYNVFLHLLHMFSNNFKSMKETQTPSSSSELLESKINLHEAIKIKFKRKYAVINSLNELIMFKSFHGQFFENPHGIISMLEQMINQQLYHIEAYQKNNKALDDDFEEKLIIILLCMEEFIRYLKNDTCKEQLLRTLKKMYLHLKNGETNKYDSILKKLDDLLNVDRNNSENSEFNKFKNVLSETNAEPYTKVYGIMNMIKLIKSKDEETYSNAHVILVLAMKMLKEEDSYTFLNCIKLLVALFDILKETVLETLIAEYHFDIDADSSDIDFKLKIGETILKVVADLGEMSYKYKDMLISCFMRGVYNQNDEFRTSNMSNLGIILRTLSYQVHHFFQEVSESAKCSSSK